jgi:hypothetical protein
MNTTSLFELQPSFDPNSFPDLRLCDRAFTTQKALAESLLHKHPFTQALRKGVSRFFKNERIDADELLRDSFQFNPRSIKDESIILSDEDTTFIRYNNDDAGPLRSGLDLGYVLHYSAAVTPGTGIPFGWLGATILSRADIPPRNQDHKTRPPIERESIKWVDVRSQIYENIKNLGFKGRIISINDREGDAWSSLSDAIDNHREIIVRSSQNRKIKDSHLKLREFLHSKPCSAKMTITVYRKDKIGKPYQTKTLVEVRWSRIYLMPPQNDIFAKKEALEYTAMELYEKIKPRKKERFKSYLLTSCCVKNIEDAVFVIKLYPNRWGIEVSNDILKNAIKIEDLQIKNKNEFKKAVALAGPVAMQIANWISLSRKPEPPQVEEIFDKETLKYLEHCSNYFNISIPDKWTMKEVMKTLGKLGGGDVREGRPPGWKIVLRGWQRFVEFSQTIKYTLTVMQLEPLAPLKKDPDP